MTGLAAAREREKDAAQPETRVDGTPKQAHIPGLDISRGLGAISVLTAHLFMALHETLPVPVPRITHALILLGNFFMEQFFALSGFLLGGMLLQNLARPRPGAVPMYAVSRITRTWPAYFAFMAVLLIFEAGLRGSWHVHWSYFFYLQNFVRGAENFFPVTWTLSVEQWSYVLLPLVILGLPKLLRLEGEYAVRAVLACALSIIILAMLARLMTAMLWHPPYDIGLRKQIPLRVDALMFGLCVACWRHGWPRIYGALASTPGMIIIVALALAHLGLQQMDGIFVRRAMLPDHYLFHGSLGLTLTGAFVALVLPFLEKNPLFFRALARFPRTSAVLFASAKYSYSLYLVHLSLFFLLRGLYDAHPPATAWGGWLAAPLTMVTGVLLTVVTAWLLYHGVEVPGMASRKYIFPLLKRCFAALRDKDRIGEYTLAPAKTKIFLRD